MITTEVTLETFSLGEHGSRHWLGYYILEGELVVSFMQKGTFGRPWEIIEPPTELAEFLDEFVDELQITTNAVALVTPHRTYR